MGELWQLYNVSIVLEYQLNAAGIKSPADLRAMGSKEAFHKLRERDETLGADVLVALEGATQGMRWYKLPKEVQQELRDYYEATYSTGE